MTILISILTGVLFLATYNKSEHFIKGKEELYDVAIEYLKSKNGSHIKKDNYETFYTYDGFGISSHNNYRYAYMWILSETCHSEDGSIISDSGSSMFYKFTFIDDKVLKYEIPEDGNEYVPSIKKMCPKRIRKKVLDYEPQLSNEDAIKEHFSSYEVTKK